MSSQPARKQKDLVSLAEFEQMPEEDGYRLELVRGRVVREPRPLPLHGRIVVRVAARLEAFVQATRSGAVFAESGFALSVDPAIVRGPDVAYVSKERIPDHGYGQGFWRFAPDLAVEVLSPSNRPGDMREKIREYFDAGARLVWVIDPSDLTVAVYNGRSDPPHTFGTNDVLDGGDVLPGLRIALAELFTF